MNRIQPWLLTLAFCLILGVVPSVQVVLEWKRGGRVQATDLYRFAPRDEALRRFERDLEMESWFGRTSRSVVRELRYALFREPGGQVMRGAGDWLFYRPGVRYLVERSSRENAGEGWKKQGRWTGQGLALEVIREFKEELGERGIELIVVPVPVKASLYADRLKRGIRWDETKSPTELFIGKLRDEGVEVLDLFTRFRELRRLGVDLYLAQDTHWTPAGAEGAAESVAARLTELDWVAMGTDAFEIREVLVWRRGDLVELASSSGLRKRYPGEEVRARQVRDPGIGLLVPSPVERPGTFRDVLGRSQVLVLGDSYSRIYQYAEPPSVAGWVDPADGGVAGVVGAKEASRLHPGSAGFVSHLARVLGTPVDALVSDGGAATEVRQRLSVNPEILEGKRVVVWEFVEHELGYGEWKRVSLPVRLND